MDVACQAELNESMTVRQLQLDIQGTNESYAGGFEAVNTEIAQGTVRLQELLLEGANNGSGVYLVLCFE